MKVVYSYLLEQFKVEEEKTKVKYVDLPKQANVAAIIKDIKELLLKTGQFTLGQPVADFEARFAKLCQTKYAIGVNSGTDALFLALKALDIGPGDEVITAPNSFVATTAVIANAGAKPVFVDVNREYNIDAGLIEKAITRRTKAILPVHLTGNPADMPRILEIAGRRHLHVVEDAAQAISAAIKGQSVGSFGDAAGFSMHPLKNLNVWGDGGLVTTNSKKIYDKIILLRNHGLRGRDEVEIFAYNSRLDTLQAIVANQLMNVIDNITDTRIKHARMYDKALADLADFITLPPRKRGVKQVFHTYVILARDRDKLGAYLAKKGIETKVHYPVPLHLQPASKYLGYQKGDFPVCEAQADAILTLPVHQHLTDAQIDYVASNIRKFYKG